METKKLLIPLMLALITGLSACMSFPVTVQEQPVGAIHTSAARTVQAQMTLSAGGTAVAQLTMLAPTATLPPVQVITPTVEGPTGGLPGLTPSATPTASATPTNTPLPPTNTPGVILPLPSATPTNTPLPPTPWPTWTPPPPTRTVPPPPPPTASVPCDWLAFVKDISIPDGSVLPAGASFTKTWRLRNIGSCTWTTNYSLVYVSGDRMHVQAAYWLNAVVRPGEMVDVSAQFVAPSAPGSYRGYWMLANAYGYTFGFGPTTQSAFWVDITVQGAVTGRGFDFAANMCNALWSNADRDLPCPGNPDSEHGSVVLLTSPVFEGGRHENEPTLWTRPEAQRGGIISGLFPAYKVHNGDRFVSSIGCLDDSKGCDVTFYLDAKIPGQPTRNLGAWQEIYDGDYRDVEVDLSSLAGQTVQFILRVENNGKAAAANAFWFTPAIYRPSSGSGGSGDWSGLPAVQASIITLGNALGISSNQIGVVQVTPYQWPDTCLGIYRPGQVCAPAIIFGYQVTLSANGRLYEAHASEDGDIIAWLSL